jgi:hypothetical protein
MLDLTSIDTTLSILEHLKNILVSDKQAKDDYPLASRFISLFEKHGVHRNQIPRFFGHGLTLVDVASNKKLLSKLTHEILQSACELFAIRLEWLEGVDEKIYETHDFYKRPEDYAEFLTQLIADGEHLTIARLVLSTDTSQEEDALLILEEHIGNEPVIRYHLCSNCTETVCFYQGKADAVKNPNFLCRRGIYYRSL